MEEELKNVAVVSRVTNIGTINPSWDDVIIVSVDVEKLPNLKRQEYMTQTAKVMKELFPNNKLIVISGKTSITLEKDTMVF